MSDTIYFKINNQIVTHVVDSIIDIEDYINNKFILSYIPLEYGRDKSKVIIGQPGTGVQFGKKKFIIDKDGYFDIKGIKEYLYNREMNQIIEKL